MATHLRRKVHFAHENNGGCEGHGPITAEFLTSEIKNCYDTVDKGRKLLGRLYDKLQQHCNSETFGSVRRDYQLLIELDNLKDVLVLIAEKRGNYIRQLEKAQNIVWHDRREMEEFFRMNRATDRRLQEKVKFFSRFPEQPDKLVNELQTNSQILSELLNDLKEQLVAEEKFIKNQVGDANRQVEEAISIGPRDRWYYIRGRRRNKVELDRKDLALKADGAGHDPGARPCPLEWKPQRESEIQLDGTEDEYASTNGYQARNSLPVAPRKVEKRALLLPEKDLREDEREYVDLPTERGENAREQRAEDYDTSSLSQKLKELVRQSENVQQLISSSSRKIDVDKRSDFDSFRKEDLSQPLLPTEYFKRSPEGKTGTDVGPDFSKFEKDCVDSTTKLPDPVEITSEKIQTSKRGTELVSTETTDHDDSNSSRRRFENVLQKCEEVERQMQGCSPKEVREKLLRNLDELDRVDNDVERILSASSSPSRQGYRLKTRVDHGYIRQEFVKCLDKIFAMEKCYGSAGDEIRSLKRELELELRDRDAMEHSFKSKIEKLKEKLRLKGNDVDFYRGRVHDLKKEFLDMRAKYEDELASKCEASKNLHEDDIKALKDECQYLKLKVDSKCIEVDDLRKELQNAIEEIHRLKRKPASIEITRERPSRETFLSFEELISKVRGSSQENISDELAALQRVIELVEQNQQKSLQQIANHRKENAHLTEENSRLTKENLVQRTKIEELELTLIAKNAEVDHISKKNLRIANEPEKEYYDVDIRMKEEECERLRKKLADYENLIARDGQDMSLRLDEFYEEFVRSIDKINTEKEILEEDFQKQRLMYEDLLAECHNEINVLTKKGKDMERILSDFHPGRRETLEKLLTSVRSPEELAEILSRDLEDGPLGRRNLMTENEALQKEQAEMQQKVEHAEKEVTALRKEIDSLTTRNKELKEKCDHLKSENYLLSRIRESDGKEKLKTYKDLLGKKEAECFRLRKILDESIDYEERDELLARLRDVHRELLQDGTTREEISLERLQESLEKRDREIRRLKRQNKLLAESLGLDEERRIPFLETVLASREDLYEYCRENIFDDQEKAGESRHLKQKSGDRPGKFHEASKLDDEVKTMKSSLDQSKDQCKALEDENFSLRERLRALQSELKELRFASRGRKFSRDTSDDLVKENEYLNEKLILKELENERFLDEINGLKENIKNHEVKASELKERLDANARVKDELESLKQENVEKDEILKDLSKKLNVVEKERKKINEEYLKEKVRNEEETKHMSDQLRKLQNEMSSATSKDDRATPVHLLNISHDSLPIDERDGGLSRYDRNRLIKKLQEENHQQSARILSLEEETTAITKIVADMERGHGHLTGMLRGHLVLQKDATSKLLEKSLHQYSDEFDSCKRKFAAIEDKYDKNRVHLTRRRFAWDLFENAKATVDNITAILVEGLIKVEDDLHDEFSSDEDFETRDYKSRIWLLRRRLDEVEKRYRDLMLRAEELSVRLDAKTAEYDVTQDELEDATRVLEVNEIAVARLRDELNASVKENARLKGIMSQLRENQQRTVGAVITENEQLKKEIDKAAEDRTEIDALQLEIKNLGDKLKVDEFEVKEMRRRLHEQERHEKETVDGLKEKGREEARRYEEETSKLQNEVKHSKRKIGESSMRIRELENQLQKAEEKIINLEKHLQKARSSCHSEGIDHHSTIHLLRDDLKKLFKENERLKEEVNSKQKNITALAKDLREAKITVKEQLGTERSLDEKMLDKATKDQMMALKRRIKILEIENAKLAKKVFSLEREQSLGESTNKKKVSSVKSSSGRKESSSSSLRNDGEEGKTEDSSKADDTVKSVSSDVFGNKDTLDNSLASVGSFKDFSSENKEEIELRDNLIRELEARVRELKLELTKKTREEKVKERNETDNPLRRVDDGTITEKDVEMLRRENAKLKESLEKQKSLPIGYQVKQKDDTIKKLRTQLGELENEIDKKDGKLKVFQKELVQMRERLGPDWKSKEIILLESDEYKEIEKQHIRDIEDLKEEIAKLEITCEKQKNTIERLEKLKNNAELCEDEIRMTSETSVETALDNLPEKDSGFVDNASKRAPKFITIGKSNNESVGERGKNLSKIPISPRLRQTKADQDKTETRKDLERKVEEQDEDIKTLLESVDYFEKEIEKKSEESDSLKQNLKNSGDEIKRLKTSNTKLQNQLKETKAQDEKLQVLEDKIKKLNSENKNLDQQMKKYRQGESQRARSPTDTPRKIASLERELSNTKKQLEMATSHVALFKNGLGMGDIILSDNDTKTKRAISDALQKRIKKERALMSSDAKKKTDLLENENGKLRTELKEKTSSLEKYVLEISALKAELEEAKTEREKVDLQLSKSNDRLSLLEAQFDKVNARSIALEAIQDAVTRSDDVQDGKIEEKGNVASSSQLYSEWSDLKELLKDLFVITEEDSISNTASVDEIAEDILKMNCLLTSQSKTLIEELDEQRKANSELENRVEEFRKIVEETNIKVAELEVEVSEKDKNDEIGHKLLLDQVSESKIKAENYEKDKRIIQEEAQRREEYIERLTEQVKILEKKIAERETENSELTERALYSEEELESMKERVEELEDDYNRLLQHGMKLDGEEGEKGATNDELMKRLNATIESLQEDKNRLLVQVEELTLVNEEFDKFGGEKGTDEYQQLEDTIYRLELDKEDLQKRIDEFLVAKDDSNFNDMLEANEKKVKSLEDAMFHLELEKATLQKAYEETKRGSNKEDEEMRVKIAELEDENSRMEEAICQLDVEKKALQKRIDELTSDEKKGDVNDLTLLLIDNEEKIADLEQEKKILLAKQEDLQKIIDDILQSPRRDEEVDSDDSSEILKGGPQSWKRRLIAAYRELREKSTELVMMKMIVESKNVEVDLLSKEISEESVSEGVSFQSEDETSAMGRNRKQLKATVFMLQEEVKMKTAEMNELKSELSSLQNELELRDERSTDRVTLKINGKEVDEVKLEELQTEIDELTNRLAEKEEQYEALCDQLFGGEPIVTAKEKAQLNNEIESLRDALVTKDREHAEMAKNYDLIYNELTRMKAETDSSTVGKSGTDLHTNHEKKVQLLESSLEEYEEKYRLMAKNFNEMEEKYTEELNYASTHIGDLMLQMSELERQLKEMRESKGRGGGNDEEDQATEFMVIEARLKHSEDELRRKNKLVENLKETLAEIYENTADQSGEVF